VLPGGMSPAEGLDAFMRVLASPYAQIVASPQDPAAIVEARRAEQGRSLRSNEAASLADGRGRACSAHDAEADAAAPRTATEKVIADIWQEVLGVPRVGVRDNFFDLGGDSVISLQFIAKAKKAGLKFTKGQVFEHQTIAELAAAVAGHGGSH